MLIGVVVVYLLGTLVAGALLSTRIKRVSDYLVAGRSLGLALSTASLAAVQIGAGVVLGGAETGASSGLWPGVWYGLGCGGGLILGGLFAAEKMRSRRRHRADRLLRRPLRRTSRRADLGVALEHSEPARHLRRPAHGRRARCCRRRSASSFQTAVLLVAGVIFVSNVLSGMWGVVFADFFQVSIIMIGVPADGAGRDRADRRRRHDRPC